MATDFYITAKKRILDENDANSINLVGATATNVALMTSSYTPNDDTDDNWGALSGELVATLYTSGGEALASRAIAEDVGNDRAEFDATDLTYTTIGNGSNGTFTQLVIWCEQGATDPLVCHIDVTSTTTNGGNVTLQWDPEGIIQLA